MKRFISTILIIVIVLSMPIITTASEITGNIVNIGSFTVEFSANSSFTTDKQNYLAQYIVDNGSVEESATTYNLLCTLFGHDTTTESITVIEHCVSDTQPRCIKSLQELTACSRCDYVDIVEISSIYVYCCE